MSKKFLWEHSRIVFKVASGGLHITYNKYLKVHLIYLLYTVCVCANSVFLCKSAIVSLRVYV